MRQEQRLYLAPDGVLADEAPESRIIRRRTGGIIESNAYDLSPLVDVLQQVAKAFPNEFPRGVRRKDQAIRPTGVRALDLEA